MKEKTDYVSRVCSIVAILMASVALWQTQYNLRPIVSLTDAKIHKNTSLPTGDLDFGLQIVFQNRGSSDIQHLTLRLVCLVENTVIGPTETNIGNRVSPSDYFTYPMEIVLPKSVLETNTQGLSKLKQDLPIRIVIEYRAIFRKHRQVFDVSWNKDMNRLQHCDVNESNRIDDALAKAKKNL